MKTEELFEIIKSTNERTDIDYKKELYNLSKQKDNFVKDIMSMANSFESGNKCIVIGVKDRPSLDREIIGIDKKNIKDAADYQQIIRDNIEPNIGLDIEKHTVENKTLLCIIISSTNNRPYVMRKDLDKLKKGDIWIRINSSQSKITRLDLENIYKERIEFKNIELQKLRIERDELSKELLFVTLLNENIIYLYKSYSDLQRFIRKHLNEKEEIQETLMKYDVKYRTSENFSNQIKRSILKIKNFECREMPKEYLYDLLLGCNYKCYEKYSSKLVEMEQSYLYLKNNLKKLLSDLQKDEQEKNFSYDEILKFYENVFLSEYRELMTIRENTYELQSSLEKIDLKINML